MCVQVPSDVKPRRTQFFFFWHENHCTLFFCPAFLFSFLLALCAHNSNQSTCITVIVLVVASFRFNVYVIASPFYIAALGFRRNTSSYQLTEGEEALSPDSSVSISLFLTSLCLHFTNWHYTGSFFFLLLFLLLVGEKWHRTLARSQAYAREELCLRSLSFFLCTVLFFFLSYPHPLVLHPE